MCIITVLFRMRIQHWGILSAIAVVTLLKVAALSDVDYSIEKYDESPGLYYENKGVAVLYNAVWKTIVYTVTLSITRLWF
jgi:hypothetical protein